MTAVIEEVETAPAVQPESLNKLAPWHFRGGAFTVDVLPGVAAVAAMALAALTVPPGGVWWWSCVSIGGLALLLVLVNRILLPTITGWSWGRAVFGIEVTRRDGVAVGPGRLLLRDLAHLLDTASVLVGWLWPLWDSRRRTFADLLLRTEVRFVERDRPRNIRRLTAVVLLTAALMCVAGEAVSYLVAFHHDRAIEATRAEIASQGPKIVEQMLTYDPKSLQDDFARAQSLATDKYREQLVPQQQVVQKAKPVANQYLVIDSSVLSATPNGATMLLFLQGQRGDPGEERFISATVKVTFAKSAGAQWRVDDLTVVTKPLPGQVGK